MVPRWTDARVSVERRRPPVPRHLGRRRRRLGSAPGNGPFAREQRDSRRRAGRALLRGPAAEDRGTPRLGNLRGPVHPRWQRPGLRARGRSLPDAGDGTGSRAPYRRRRAHPRAGLLSGRSLSFVPSRRRPVALEPEHELARARDRGRRPRERHHRFGSHHVPGCRHRLLPVVGGRLLPRSGVREPRESEDDAVPELSGRGNDGPGGAARSPGGAGRSAHGRPLPRARRAPHVPRSARNPRSAHREHRVVARRKDAPRRRELGERGRPVHLPLRRREREPKGDLPLPLRSQREHDFRRDALDVDVPERRPSGAVRLRSRRAAPSLVGRRRRRRARRHHLGRVEHRRARLRGVGAHALPGGEESVLRVHEEEPVRASGL